MQTRKGKEFFPFVISPEASLEMLTEVTKELEKSFELGLCYKDRGTSFWKDLFGEEFPEKNRIAQELSGRRVPIVWVSCLKKDEGNILSRYQKVQNFLEKKEGIYAPICFGDWAHMYSYMRNSPEFPDLNPEIVYFPVILKEAAGIEGFVEVLRKKGIQRGVTIFSQNGGSLTIFLEIERDRFTEKIFGLFSDMNGIEFPHSMEQLSSWNAEIQSKYNYPPIGKN